MYKRNAVRLTFPDKGFAPMTKAAIRYQIAPRAEPELAAHLMRVSQSVGRAIQRAFQPTKVGMVILGLEVPHVHVHVSPLYGMRDLDFAQAGRKPDPASMDAAADKIRTALRDLGHTEASD